MRILNRNAETSTPRWGWTDWLLVAASAGLCVVAWRLIGDVRALRDENESDIRTLRDEYARLERERAELYRQLTSVNERLAQLEAAPAPEPSASLPSSPITAPASPPLTSAALNGTPDTLSEASMTDAAEVKAARTPRRPRRTPENNGTSPTPRKPRPRKTPPNPDSGATD